MEYRILDVTVLSADDLNKVNLISKMDPYVVVYLAGGSHATAAAYKHKTPIDRDGDTNPSWNYPIKLTFNESEARTSNRLTLVFEILCSRSLGDKLIGEVHVPIKELLSDGGDLKSKPQATAQFVSYQVRKPCGKPKGVLNFSYKLGDYVKSTSDPPPVTAYPAAAAVPGPSAPPHTDYGYPYPPPHMGYGYPPPPPPPQQYPPPPPYGGYAPTAYPAQTSYSYGQYGYGPGSGYPSVVQPKRNKNNKLGMGLGAGLLGGALAGFVVGDLVSDFAGDGYDQGFDPGFGDMGGFGF
ncbi:hypothetical protein Dimus_008571 [Dionaea muscipula]